MKRAILGLSLLFFSLEAEEPLPSEIQIDLSRSSRDKLLYARKQGWDLSQETKAPVKEKEPALIEFGATAGADPLNSSDNSVNTFRKDMSEQERCRRMDRLNDINRNLHPPVRK
jgi:hypothetical protein